jgi:cytochrome c553
MPNVLSGTCGVLLRQKNSSGGMVHAATYRRACTRATILRIMKILSCMLALLFISNVSVAQDASASRSLSYVPSLGDMMTAIQLRHSKLWYAVKTKNWSLADYELRQLDTSLKEGKRLYPNIPGWDIAGSDKVAVAIGEALKAKNEAKFDQAFTQLTTECNACHRAAGRAFIYIRRPTFPSPFSNQVFAPRGE